MSAASSFGSADRPTAFWRSRSSTAVRPRVRARADPLHHMAGAAATKD